MPGCDAETVSLDANRGNTGKRGTFDVRQAISRAQESMPSHEGVQTKFQHPLHLLPRPVFNGTKVADYKLPEAAKTSTKIIGARVGGPIIRDKLFFFLNGEYENQRYPEWNGRHTDRTE
jgi:hypothetical protein